MSALMHDNYNIPNASWSWCSKWTKCICKGWGKTTYNQQIWEGKQNYKPKFISLKYIKWYKYCCNFLVPFWHNFEMRYMKLREFNYLTLLNIVRQFTEWIVNGVLYEPCKIRTYYYNIFILFKFNFFSPRDKYHIGYTC